MKRLLSLEETCCSLLRYQAQTKGGEAVWILKVNKVTEGDATGLSSTQHIRFLLCER